MTWLFIPSNCLPASACSEKDCEPGSNAWASRLAQSATLNGNLTRPQSWRLAFKKAAWTRLLSGPTLPPSTLDAGLEPWIASLRDSRAKTCQLPACAPALTGPDQGFSSRSCASPAIAVRNGSFWRTSQASLLPPPPLWTKPKGLSKSAPPPESWENWPISGGIRSGLLFPRPTWVPAMGVPGGFASPGGQWTTPDVCSGARDMSKVDPEAQKRADTKRTTELPAEAAYWMAPSVSNSQGNEYTRDRCQPGQGRLTLKGQAQQWPTPASRDYRTPNSQESQESRKHTGGEQLPNYVEHHFSPPVQQAQAGPKSSDSDPTSPRRLNPAFVEWLMGWPIGWTIAEPSASSAAETALWRRRLLRHLSNFIGD